MFAAIEKAITLVSQIMFFLASIAIVFMMFHISGDVIARTFFGMGIPGTLEITAEWYMISIVYLPLALVHLRGGHISVDLFTQFLSQKYQSALIALTSFAALIFIYYWADASYTLALKKTKRLSYLDSGLWQIPTWPVYWACFVAIVILFFATCIVLIRAVRDARSAG
jgi:TRAP-type C4-dicarboxylate transport system permease small subunit